MNYRRKNRIKIVRSIIQLALIVWLCVVLYQLFFVTKLYEDIDKTDWSNEQGFIALSYFGVDRIGTPKLIARKQLAEQLEVLHEQGYETISQQDIINFYHHGHPLPDKALFLSFEDGRNDSSLFAQPILEQLNYKATFLTYSDKMGDGKQKFLQPKQLLDMESTGFWELGSNGHRLSYINIFDEDGRFVGVRDESELTRRTTLAYYNHYLMDFIRDEHMIPIENRGEMEARITADYDAMHDIYTETLGYVPDVYMIMHANALNQGMHPLVSNINDINIKKRFNMHFNREGWAFNSADTDIYNLTRLQPAPYWSTNHLLMKIQRDVDHPLTFTHGDEEEASKWQQLNGIGYFTEQSITLTSPPKESGLLYLVGSDHYQDVHVSTRLMGNVVGQQTIYLRYDRNLETFIRIVLHDNVLLIEQKKSGEEAELLYSEPLDDIKIKDADLTFDKASVYSLDQALSGHSQPEDEYPVNIIGDRLIEVALEGQALTINVDGTALLNAAIIDDAIGQGGIALGAQYSEANEKDDIYDAIFANLQINVLYADAGGDSDGDSVGEELVFSHKTSLLGRIATTVQGWFTALLNWIIDTF